MTIDFWTFNSCTSSIKRYIKTSTILISNNVANEVNISLGTICSASKGARLLYNILVNDNCMPNCCLHWSEKLKSNISWNTVFIKVQKITDVKLKWLQMRITHRIIATHIVLNLRKLESLLTLSVASATTKKIALNMCFENALVSDVFGLHWKQY